MKRAVIFPGQGSQFVGMGKDFSEAIPACKELFDRASEILGYDLESICFDGPQEELNKSNNAQLGIFIASAAALKATEMKQPDLEYHYLAGHSLGEWTALYAAGVVDFDTVIKILRARGEAMQSACEQNHGAMMAVMGIDGEELEKLAQEAGCYVANFNSLAQTVLSGTEETIAKAEELCKEAGVKRAIRLPVAGAFHSPLMQPAADIMTEYLADVDFAEEKVPVLSNVTAVPHGNCSVKDDMIKQITSSVQWVHIIQWLVKDGVEEIVEVGPGKVLAGLIKRIDKSVAVRNIGQLSDLEN